MRYWRVLLWNDRGSVAAVQAEGRNHGKAGLSTRELSDVLVATSAHAPRRRQIGPTGCS